VTNTTTKKILSVTLTNGSFDAVARANLDEEELILYNALNTTYGNRDYLFDVSTIPVSGDGMSYEIPPEALSDQKFANMIKEAEKYLGYPYVWGGSSPSTSFDCSGYVSWVINNCGNGWSYGRMTADGLRSICTYVSPSEAKPGDLIFFQKTYNTSGASHVGIYVGNGMMIHCGNPIKYSNINTSYWQEHFLCYGRLP
jgi:cell wall-associated NlpC family hydrolase